jgi:hypothetical protein
MQPRFVLTISSLSSQRSVLCSSSFRIPPSSCLSNSKFAFHHPKHVTIRYRSDQADNQSRTPPVDVKSQDTEPQDQGDTRPPPPELDLKVQNSEEMIELQKEQEIKEQQKKSGKSPKADILEEKEMSKAEQRKVNWGILKTLVKYIWPKVQVT